MVFASKVFLFAFLPGILLSYFMVPRHLRNYVLLAASICFYAFGEPKFVFVMLLSVLLSFFIAVIIDASSSSRRKRMFLILFIGINLGMLFIFKYSGFFIRTTNRFFGSHIPMINIALPIGISFFTFQAMSYVIDVYRKDIPPQRNPLKLGLYISLFPQLIAGPIVRYADVAEQIDLRTTNVCELTLGIRRFVIGLSKKVLIADILASKVDRIFALGIDSLTTPIAWIGVLCYTLQIYFDFSGYSDMAIGLGRMFGFHFLENFRYPYQAGSITDFWRRWHMSLSSWFRDYLYIPLGGNRRGNVYLHLLIVFLCTGLWHGASFTFLVWGLWHGAFLIIERVARKRREKKLMTCGFIGNLTTLMIIIIGWVIFRSSSLQYAWGYLSVLFGKTVSGFKPYSPLLFIDSRLVVTFLIGCVAATDVGKRVGAYICHSHVLRSCYYPVLLLMNLILFFICVLFIMNEGYSPFIYFRF